MTDKIQTNRTADICLIAEGSYPYVSGGVASWAHDLITALPEFSFHLVTLMPRDQHPELRYTLPSNVTGLTTWHLQDMPEGRDLPARAAQKLSNSLEQVLSRLTVGQADIQDFQRIIDAMSSVRTPLGSKALLDSPAAWQLVTDMYERSFAESSLLDYFWSWRALFGGLYSLLLPPLPSARLYHSLSTGYAGLVAARAKLETGRPALLTEHGIYTNERRIEIASADWLEETASKVLTVERTRSDLRDLWIHSFINYSRICYQASDQIVTLYSGNQPAQLADGAAAQRMRIIPNGVDVERFENLPKRAHTRPTIALLGRVVPIKDVKSFIRACAILRDQVPDLNALIIGGSDEDPVYAAECVKMVEYFALENNVTFTGRVIIDDYLPDIDILIFSSISEAQPLAILEAGACGIPTVATDVGACREMILGSADEEPGLGAGGAVVPLSNPRALADATFKLIRDKEWYAQCSTAMSKRVSTYYNKRDQVISYRNLYSSMM